MIKTAVVIVGGEGSRLRPLTDDKPKALVEVGGKPILYWVICWLKKQGIEHLVLGVAYKKEKVYEFMQQNNNFGLEVDFSEHTVEGGTAQGFKLAIERFVKDENFLAMNGDELTNMDLKKMAEKHSLHKPIVTLALAPFHCRFSVVKLKEDSKIRGFDYGPKLPQVPVSIGIYIFNSKIKDYLPPMGSIEDMVFAWFAKEGKLAGHILLGEEEWVTVNTLKDIAEAEEKLNAWNFNAAL